MSRYIASTVVLLVVAWIGLYFATKVGRADVIVKNEYSRDTNAGLGQVSAGDVLVVYPDYSMEPLCDLNLDKASVATTTLSETYFNAFAESFSFFVTVMNQLYRIAGLGGGEDAGGENAVPVKYTSGHGQLRFFGKEESIREVSSAPTTDECLCKTARQLSLGRRVCTVNATLVETQLLATAVGPQASYRTIAVKLARHPNFVTAEKFKACGVDYTKEAKIAEQTLCNDGAYRFPLDAELRTRFGLIEKRTDIFMSTASGG